MGAPAGASAYAAFSGEFFFSSAPNGFKDVTRSMKIPNMCLVLKLDNRKVVSIASGQTHRVTQPPSTVLVYR